MPKHNKILIVDDEDLVRQLLKQVIDRIRPPETVIFLAEDGEEALKVVEKERPDLILLDVMMPKLNGYDVCKAIRQIEQYSPHVIILTARGNSNDQEQAKTTGANEFMTKPFNPSRLTTRLKALWAN